MKWIIFIIVTSSYQGGQPGALAVDHVTFATEAACEQFKKSLEDKPNDAKGFMGAVNAINNTLGGPRIDARCIAVDDGAGE